MHTEQEPISQKKKNDEHAEIEIGNHTMLGARLSPRASSMKQNRGTALNSAHAGTSGENQSSDLGAAKGVGPGESLDAALTQTQKKHDTTNWARERTAACRRRDQGTQATSREQCRGARKITSEPGPCHRPRRPRTQAQTGNCNHGLKNRSKTSRFL
jgi:hypothetical protein